MPQRDHTRLRASLRTRRAVLTVAVALSALSSLLLLYAVLRVRATGIPGPQLTLRVEQQLLAATSSLALVRVAAAFWTHGAYGSLEGLGRSGLARHRSVSTWLGWFVPIVQLVLPPLVLGNLIDLSGPDWNRARRPASSIRSRRLLAAWAVAFPAAMALLILAAVQVVDTNAGTIALAVPFLVATAIVHLLALGLLVVLAHHLTRRLLEATTPEAEAVAGHGRDLPRRLLLGGTAGALLFGGIASVALVLPPADDDRWRPGERAQADAPSTGSFEDEVHTQPGDPSAPDGGADPVLGAFLRAGMCLRSVPFDGFDLVVYDVVPCGVPHRGEVAAVVTLDEEPWPGDAEVIERADAACVAAVPDYLGAELVDTPFEIVTITPAQEAWPRYRDVRCITLLPIPLPGSVAGIEPTGSYLGWTRFRELSEGDCVRTSIDTWWAALKVACDRPHDLRSVGAIPFPGDDRPDEDELWDWAYAACEQRRAGTGDPADASPDLATYVVLPDLLVWEAGDRRVTCLVGLAPDPTIVT